MSEVQSVPVADEIVEAVAIIEELKEARGETQIGKDLFIPALRASWVVETHPNYLAKLAKRGDLPYYRDSRKRIWFKQTDLDAYIASRAQIKAERAARPKGSKSNKKYRQLPMAIRHLKWLISLLESDAAQDLTEDTLGDVQAWAGELLSAEVTSYLEKQEAATATAEAVTADADFQEELKSAE